MKIYLLCQGLNANEIDRAINGFDHSQIGAVVAEGVKLTQKFKNRFFFDFYDSNEKLLEQVNPELICIMGMSDHQFILVSSLLKSGVSVISKTPLTFSQEQINRLFSLAERNNAHFYIHFSELFLGAKSRLSRWADHIVNSASARIKISIILNRQSSIFRQYIGPNKPHWCYELPCGVFHQELEKSLNLLQPLLGRAININVSETSSGYLPQNISDNLVIDIEGSRMNATVKIKICEKISCRKILLLSDGDEVIIKEGGDKASIHDTEISENYMLIRYRKLANSFSRIFNRPLKREFHSVDDNELADIYDNDSVLTQTSVNLELYHFVHRALLEIASKLCNIHLSFKNSFIIDGDSKSCKRVLITGASGLFGKRLSQYLNNKQYVVRAFIRKLSDPSYFQALGIEYCFGDVVDKKSLKQALEGVDYVVHAAADTSGDLDVGEISTVQGTKNILDLCSQLEIERMVYISSCNVYDVFHLKGNAEIDESSLLEQFPERRGGYTITKLKADLLVQAAINNNRGNFTCLRPGTYISEYGPFMTPIVGVRLIKNYFAVFGLGNLVLPLVFIENLCSATELSLTSDKAEGETFNVIDSLSMSKKDYLDKILRKIESNAHFIFFPYKLLYFLIFLQEVLLDIIGRKPYLTRYRFESSQKEIRYKSNKIEELLGWSPPISADEAIERILSEQKRSRS